MCHHKRSRKSSANCSCLCNSRECIRSCSKCILASSNPVLHFINCKLITNICYHKSCPQNTNFLCLNIFKTFSMLINSISGSNDDASAKILCQLCSYKAVIIQTVLFLSLKVFRCDSLQSKDWKTSGKSLKNCTQILQILILWINFFLLCNISTSICVWNKSK